MLAREAALHVSEINAQSIANTAWTCATLGQLYEKLFAAFPREGALRLSKFNAQRIAKTGWAFAMLGKDVITFFWPDEDTWKVLVTIDMVQNLAFGKSSVPLTPRLGILQTPYP